MAFIPLKDRLANLPLIIAGPMLRQVLPDQVTVWAATKDAVDVTLKVYELDSGVLRVPLMEAQRRTTTIGKNLHIVAVTARAGTVLKEGKVYFYDLEFQNPVTSTKYKLVEAITRSGQTQDISRLTYKGYQLPSFALPPADINKLRLVHGSCRKPHGGGPVSPDALSTLNTLIGDDADDPYKRPHQLLLTGDQIYADEVEESLLAALTDAGDTLLGWTQGPNAGSQTSFPEAMPGVAGDGPHQARNLPPSTRTPLLQKAGLTSDDTRSHLMSLGEYFAMYLFAWSEELWTTPPTFTELEAMLPGGARFPANIAKDIIDHKPAVDSYRRTLPEVRRALANIPTYMICDDHEVTDDWNMTLDFCNGVYGNLLGRRIMQNGLIAYAICQAWGNLPEQFEEIPEQPAGLKLLKQLQIVGTSIDNSQRYANATGAFMQFLGVHKREDMNAVGPSVRVFHDITAVDTITVNGVKVSTSSLRYNYSVEGPEHQVIVTDTRTWRWFITPSPASKDFPGSELFMAWGPKPRFLYDQLDVQLHRQVPPLNNRQLIVVCSTNAPCIASIRMFGRIAPKKSWINTYDLFDSWEFPSRDTDTFIAMLTDKLPLVKGKPKGAIVFLSGDVHFSFSSRMVYWAEKQRLGDTPGNEKQPSMVIAQLVSSSLKNQADKTIGTQVEGYTYQPPDVEAGLKKLAVKYQLAPIAAYIYYSGVSPPHAPEAYVGWNLPVGAKKRKVGRIKSGWIQSGDTLYVNGAVPVLPANLNFFKDVELTETPDYRYRLDFMTTVRTGQTVPAAPTNLPTNVGNKTEALRSHAKAAVAHRDLIDKGATPPDCIGFNNIGEISFVLLMAPDDPTLVLDRMVRHRMRWQEANKPPYWAEYEISLIVDDLAFPKLP